jgi:hypothetical protein
MEWWRQQMSGNFLDVIFDCPHEIEELTASRTIYDDTKDLNEDHKEILYYRAIRQWTPQAVAALRGQTDRNIRKVYNAMIENIRRKLYLRLEPHYRADLPLTTTQRQFCVAYLEQLDENQRAKIMRKIKEVERLEGAARMNSIFQKTSAFWAKYSAYEYRKDEDGMLYITPEPTAKPSVYDPLENAEAMVLDALNVGRLVMRNIGIKQTQEAVLDFVSKYGLFGFMTALPTTPDFMDYEAVYLPKNHFIKKETMNTHEYVALYFPFGKPDFYKDERTAAWHMRGNAQADRELLALAMTFSSGPMAMNMTLQRDYAERYDWLVTQFQDLAFTLASSHLYYTDKDVADETTLEIYRQGISAFGGLRRLITLLYTTTGR